VGQSARRVIQSKDLKRFVEVDGVDNAMVGIGVVSYRIHQGDYYRADNRVLAVGSGAAINMLIQTGSCCVHARFYGAPQRLTLFTLSKNPTHTGAIDSVPQNKNLCEEDAAKLRFHNERVILTPGTAVFSDYLGQAAGGQRQLFGEGEIVLEANTKYLLESLNTSTSAGVISHAMEFYEVP
jgi:hypothetical protein